MSRVSFFRPDCFTFRSHLFFIYSFVFVNHLLYWTIFVASSSIEKLRGKSCLAYWSRSWRSKVNALARHGKCPCTMVNALARFALQVREHREKWVWQLSSEAMKQRLARKLEMYFCIWWEFLTLSRLRTCHFHRFTWFAVHETFQSIYVRCKAVSSRFCPFHC